MRSAGPVVSMQSLTTTIKREYLRKIVAGRKRVEYREMKPYWARRRASVQPPFTLRLINGMQPAAPECAVVVRRVRRNGRTGQFELSVGRVVEVRNWDRRREAPARRR